MGHYYVKEDETFNTTRNGTVPKPTQEDIEGNKVLKADGSWGEGGSGGASSMADLTDVDLTGLSDGDTLVYDEEEEKFVPGSSGNVDGVEVNGESVVDENKVAKIVSYKELTRAEYDALPDTKFTDGVMYCIKDGFSNPNGFPPLIYSTEEREVGVWIDGKPLYQKTVTILKSSCTITNRIMTIPFLGSNENLIEIVNAFSKDSTYGRVEYGGELHDSNSSSDYMEFCWFYSSLCLYTTNTNYWANITDITITYQYTKTTDTPGSGKWATDGGLAHHYSTTEQVIGTWIDGKPIYEKTWDLGSPGLTVSYNSWTVSSIPKSGFSMIISAEAINQTGKAFWGDVMTSLEIGGTDYLSLQTARNGNSENYRYLTLRYIKTTD